MMMGVAGRVALGACLCCSALAPAGAQDADPAVADSPLVAAPVAAQGTAVAAATSAEGAAIASDPVIPKLTLVFLEMLDQVSSATAQPGDTFRLKLVSPIAVGDRVVVQAGALATGEVVHAKKKGGSGAGGELILAARYIELPDGRRIKLRSMQMISNGTSEDGKVQLVTAAVGVFGMLVKGRDTIIVPGRTAQAKVAEDFPLAPLPAQASAEAQAVAANDQDSSASSEVDTQADDATQGVE